MWRTKKPPRTLDEAADRVLKLLSRKECERLALYTKHELIDLHHTLGMYIRNEFGLWGGENEALLSQFEYRHPDDISSIIIETAWRKLRMRNERRASSIAQLRRFFRVHR